MWMFYINICIMKVLFSLKSHEEKTEDLFRVMKGSYALYFVHFFYYAPEFTRDYSIDDGVGFW